MKHPMRISFISFFILYLVIQTGCSMKKNQSRRGLNQAIDPDSVSLIMKKVADWQVASILSDGWKHPKRQWTNAVFYTGLFEFARFVDDSSYFTFLKEIGQEFNWEIDKSKSRYFADAYCIGQMYCQLYDIYRNPQMISDVRRVADELISRTHDEPLVWKNKIYLREWAWCDALFMAPNTLALLARVTKEDKYLDLADSLWWKTTGYLYDSKANLYYRDSRYFNKKEKNGAKVFWSRGNAWVMAGLVRVLENMPKDYNDRSKWEQLYQEMADTIVSLQQPDGTWHSSLLDPKSYPLKETSGTSLFCYALAWGINNGLLNGERYISAVWKSWKELVACVEPDGKLGYVQQVGTDPRDFSREDTDVYAVGGFLLAGCQVEQIAKKLAVSTFKSN